MKTILTDIVIIVLTEAHHGTNRLSAWSFVCLLRSKSKQVYLDLQLSPHPQNDNLSLHYQEDWNTIYIYWEATGKGRYALSLWFFPRIPVFSPCCRRKHPQGMIQLQINRVAAFGILSPTMGTRLQGGFFGTFFLQFIISMESHGHDRAKAKPF